MRAGSLESWHNLSVLDHCTLDLLSSPTCIGWRLWRIIIVNKDRAVKGILSMVSMVYIILVLTI